MPVSVFDLFTIGIGPSSSHTVGPMRAARRFALTLRDEGLLERVGHLRVELFGSLGATGRGHGSDRAVILGLLGDEPETTDAATAADRARAALDAGAVPLLGGRPVRLTRDDLILHRHRRLPFHPNGMRFRAYADGTGPLGDVPLAERIYYSVGGGFVVDETSAGSPAADDDLPYPFASAAELLEHCARSGVPISEVMRANELTLRSEQAVRTGLLEIWRVMCECVREGCQTEGTLPGGLNVPRRAPQLYRRLIADSASDESLRAMDWLNLFALAVNEQNAAGRRVVTAPTNGAAGIIPAVLSYYARFVPEADDDGVVRFLLTAGAIGALYKQNASISGAEVGCQGEVGSACSMAAGALCEVLGGSPRQVENAAEIGMEHNLGLTCDPIGGLVQVPCIERNAMAAVKAVNAARIARYGTGEHVVSLDKVIATMRRTGADMKAEYKETSRGGLAVNIIEC